MTTKTLRDEAFSLIIKGTLLSLAALVPASVFPLLPQIQAENQEGSHLLELLNLLSNLFVFCIFVAGILAGYVFLSKGGLKYAKSIGYPAKIGWLGLLNWLGLSILLILPDRSTNANISIQEKDAIKTDPFCRFNIPEITSLLFVSLSLFIWILFLLLGNLFYRGSFNYEASIDTSYPLQKYLALENSLWIFWFILWIFVVTKLLSREKIDLRAILGLDNKLSMREICFVVYITLINLMFSFSFSSLSLYCLSFIFPTYVVTHINVSQFNDGISLFLWAIIAVVMAPIAEELLYRGLILHKWSIKWNMKWGIWASSLLFALCHFRFDVITLVLLGAFWSILYIKTANLLAPILSHAIYNSVVVLWAAAYFFSQPISERGVFISISDYQESIEPRLGIYIFLTVIFAILIIYTLREMWPKKSASLPYFGKIQVDRKS